jgi:hypothetical protein
MDPVKTDNSGIHQDNINLSQKNSDSWLTDPKAVLDWCTSQGVVPMPCAWGTKKSVRQVWERTLETQGFPGCGGFLNDCPPRRAAIEEYWRTHEHPHKQMNNISLPTGWGGICSIDCDTLQTMKLAETLINAPKILSKKGGKFILRLIGEAPTQVQYAKTKPQKGEKPSVGLEFFSSGKHVLIYGMHPDDVPYKFYPQDIPSMTWDEIYAVLVRIANQTGLTHEIIKGSSKSPPGCTIEPDVITKAYINSPRAGQNISDWFNLPYPVPINSVQNGDNLQGAHPVHGSTGGNNFSVDIKTGRYFCFRHQVGGDRFMWLLVENHIIECEQAGGGWKGLTRRQQTEAHELLKELYPERYEEYRKLSPKTGGTRKVKGATETSVPALPDSLPDHHITLLNGLARIGKSTFGVKCLMEAGQGLFIAHTHSIMENAMRLMHAMWAELGILDRTAVCVVGKQYSCNDELRQGRCNGCPKAPKNPTDEDKPGISVLALDSIAKDLLQKKRMLTKDNIPSEYCPYHIMMHAHDNADYVFMVPFFSSVDDDSRRVRGRGLGVIDEGPTCDYYRAPCAEIATYQRLKYGGLVVPAWGDTQEKWFSNLKEYVEHRLDDENGKPSPRKPGAVDICITSILDNLLTVYSLLTQFNLAPTPSNLEKTTEELKKIDFKNTYSRDFKMAVLRKVEEYSKEVHIDSNAMDELFVISLYPGDASFSWQGDNPSKLFFVSDDSLYLLPDFEKLLVIGASQGEWFVKDYANARDITDISKIHVTGFPFAENYLFVKLTGSNEDKLKKIKEKDPDTEIDQTKTQRSQFNKFIRAVHTRNTATDMKHPSLLITASKIKQEALQKRLNAGSSLITDHSIRDVFREVYLTGNIGIYTQNSCISRGIDVQFFDRVFFNPGGFATPALTARIQYLEEQIKETQWKGLQEGNTTVDVSAMEDEIAELENKRAEIQTDEITNNVLRSAPIPSDSSSTKRLKIVVMCENDYQKLDYRIKNITQSIAFNDEEDPNLLLTAMDSIHHPVGATDINPDRPSPLALKKSEALSLEPTLTLAEQKNRIVQYTDYNIQCIDRDNVPYEKIINMIANHSALTTINNRGQSKRIGKKAMLDYLLVNVGTHISEKAIKSCIALALSDRLLLDERQDGKIFYRLHPNVVAYKAGLPLTGPDYPESLKIIHK